MNLQSIMRFRKIIKFFKKESGAKMAQERLTILITVLFVIFHMSTVSADIIHLKNGNVFEGKVIERNDTHLVVELKIGKTRIDLNEVESIEEKELPAEFLKEDKPQSEIELKEEAPEVEELNQEEMQSSQIEEPPIKVEEERPPYGINLEAKYLKEDSKEIIDITGTTHLPDNTLIFVFFKRLDNFIASGQTMVKDNQFSIRFGPFEKRILAGRYSVEADFFPYRQSEDVIKVIKAKFGSRKLELIHTSYALTIDKPEQPQLSEKKVKEEMISVMSELKTLYTQLKKAHVENRAKADKSTWNKWSDNWLSQLEKVEVQFKERTQNDIPLFPRAQKYIGDAFYLLSCLHRAYSLEINDPAEFRRRENDPEARAGSAMLEKCFQDVMGEAMKEVKSN